jgi:phosphoribosylformylglycinamidine cyclo-ligase
MSGQDQDSRSAYVAAGVDYKKSDRFKKAAQRLATETGLSLRRHHRVDGLEFEAVFDSIGESAALVEFPEFFLAHTIESLGTKNLVADAMDGLTAPSTVQAEIADVLAERAGKLRYGAIAQDAVAMILNDLTTCGATPAMLMMLLAVGDDAWFNDEPRYLNLLEGFRNAAVATSCFWGGGETPTLSTIVSAKSFVLGGSASGIICPKSRRVSDRVQPGDAIIFFESSGIHANGLSVARKVAKRLDDGYLTKVDGGMTFGEALLVPTHLYSPVIEHLRDCSIDLHGVVNITGHGLCKLMRSPRPLSYVIDVLPEPQPVFAPIQECGGEDGSRVSDREMYGTFNMGVGFAAFVAAEDVQNVWRALRLYDEGPQMAAMLAGHVEASEERRVVLVPKGINYGPADLNIR